MKQFLTILTIFFSTGCSFNHMYLHPTKLPPIPPEKDKVTFISSTPQDTTLVVFDAKTLQPNFLNSNGNSMNPDFTVESVIFRSANGNHLNGWLLKQKDMNPKVTILHFHGNAGFLLSQYQAMTPLLKFGFQIFVFDYSGFGFSEGKATRDNILIDGHSALSYLRNRDDVKNTKILIYGQSLGGHLSAVVAQQRQADIDGLVIEGAFSSHKDIAAIKAGFLGRIFVHEKYSAQKSIQKYTKPLLVIHSTEDETIPFKFGQKIYAMANEPKEFYEIKKCHMCGPGFYADSISVKIQKMLQ